MRPRIIAAGLAALVAVLLAANVVLLLRDDSEPSSPIDEASAAVAAALSYDHRALDEGLSAATALMTDDFAAEFSDTFERTVRPTATEQRAVARATVRHVGVVDQDDDTATALLYVDQVIGGDVVTSRVLATLRRVDNAWRLAALDPL